MQSMELKAYVSEEILNSLSHSLSRHDAELCRLCYKHLEMNYYVNVLGRIGSNGFQVK